MMSRDLAIPGLLKIAILKKRLSRQAVFRGSNYVLPVFHSIFLVICQLI